MPKKIDRSAQIGDAGIALIHRQVNEMGYVWREKGKDAGVDGEIEFRDPVTGEVTNRRLLVQSKASENRFPGETDRSFHSVCKDSDVDYWMNADRPVLIICSHPSSGGSVVDAYPALVLRSRPPCLTLDRVRQGDTAP